ncbi:hypothetical protein [Nostoc sp.]
MEHIATTELPETLQQIFAEIQRTKTPLTPHSADIKADLIIMNLEILSLK